MAMENPQFRKIFSWKTQSLDIGKIRKKADRRGTVRRAAVTQQPPGNRRTGVPQVRPGGSKGPENRVSFC